MSRRNKHEAGIKVVGKRIKLKIAVTGGQRGDQTEEEEERTVFPCSKCFL